ncbi:DMT family transporter [Desulfurococcus mucosus]|uniref:EamA domain-containing protein n=2 Tax=Desulfurococcus mucosus TaxID=2275 RepID=E8R8U6_DESM0|nr:protein of unknown function DUF6 transmembrane [Desulfurococcus mucosus DSM 2162]
MPMLTKHIFLLPVVWVAISSASILVRLSGVPGEVCAFWRMFFSSLLLLPLWLHRGKGFKWYHVASGLALALHFILWMKSLFMVSVYTSTLLVVLYPLYSLIIDVLIHGYRPSMPQVLGFTAAVASLTVYTGVNNLVYQPGAILSLMAGLLVALYFEIGRYARGAVGESLSGYVFPTYASAAFFTLMYNMVSGVSIFPVNPLSYLYFALMALIPMMLGHTLMNYLLKHYPAYLVTSISLGEPFGAGLLAYFILGEGMALPSILTGVATVLSIVAVIYGYGNSVPD